MKNKKHILILLFLLSITTLAQSPKYVKWLTPSYFRGYNILYENPKRLKDFTAFRNYGGNLFQIGTKGFIKEDPPYDTITANILGTDQLVDYCRVAGIYYTICVRSGPGAYDTYEESSGIKGESRIWEEDNTTEQSLYCEMLKMIADRYKDDTLFVGLNLMVEPRPKVRQVPANTSEQYKFILETIFNVHMDVICRQWIDAVREIDPSLPLIMQSFAYSTPELFPPYSFSDEYLIYESHMYQPNEFTKAETPYSVSYPGVYFNLTYLSPQLYNADFIRETIYGKVREFQQTTGYPFILGEGGMYLPQNGGQQYIADMLQPCLDWGWHFALWDWRRGRGPSQEWNIENFQGDNHAHWLEVLQRFNAPMPPALIQPADNSVNVNLNPVFNWSYLSDYTQFDFELYDGSLLAASDSNLTYNYYAPQINLSPGTVYMWRVSSNNPNGPDGEWSEFYSFTTDGLTGHINNNEIPEKFGLYNNYPNPFNPSTTIHYDIAKTADVSLIVYDVLGREISRLVSGNMQPGKYTAAWNASNYPSGLYFYKLTAGEFTSVKKMILVK